VELKITSWGNSITFIVLKDDVLLVKHGTTCITVKVGLRTRHWCYIMSLVLDGTDRK